MLNIDDISIAAFLDAADRVLNSNTSLFDIGAVIENEQAADHALRFFLEQHFSPQIIAQDKTRGWRMFYTYDKDGNEIEPVAVDLVKENIDLNIKEQLINKFEYLVAMLTGNTRVGNFRSFYNMQLDEVTATTIAGNFIEKMAEYKPWKLYIVQPDFLYTNEDNRDELYYFEAHGACNSATLIACASSSYLLLMNGTP